MKSIISNIPSIICLIGSAIIFVNALSIAYLGSAPVIYAYPASSVDELVDAPLWYRISFGIPSLTSGLAIIFWLAMSIICLTLSIYMLLKPFKAHVYSFLIIILSIACLPMGGGFLLGTLLTVLGGGMGLQRGTPWQETFFGKLLRAARFDSDLFISLKGKSKALIEPILAIIFINFLSGLGGNTYTLNAETILSDPQAATSILLYGETKLDLSIFNLPSVYIGLSIMKWILLSSIIYLFGTKLFRGEAKFDAVARVSAFCYAPVALQFFIPFIIPNQPHLSDWPLTVVLITNFWMIFALIIGVKAIYEFSMRKTLGIIIIGGSIYWLLTYRFLLPIVFGTTLFPGLNFQINPIQFLFTLFSIGILISLFLGTFSER